MSLAAGIEYVERGPGDGDAGSVVCLHGIGGDRRSFAALVDALSSRYRVIAWSMPGYGGSAAAESLDFVALAAALERFTSALGIGSAHLVGQSIGGMLAIEAALRRPSRVASLTLIATTSAFGGRDDSFRDAFLAARLAPLDAGESMASLAARFVPEIVGSRCPPDVLDAAIRTMADVPEATYRQVLDCLVTFDRRDDVGALDTPVCLIAGGEDRNAPAGTMRRLAGRLADAEYHEIDGAGHLVNAERAAETNAIVGRFLDRVSGAA